MGKRDRQTHRQEKQSGETPFDVKGQIWMVMEKVKET